MEKLSLDQKKHLVARVAALDPDGQIVSLKPNEKFNGGSAVYNRDSGIVLHEKNFLLKDEEYVRAYLVDQPGRMDGFILWHFLEAKQVKTNLSILPG